VCHTTPPRSVGRARAPDGFVHGRKLLVAAKLADRSARIGVPLEDDEISHEVEQVLRPKHSLEEDVLRQRLSTKLTFELADRLGIRDLPFAVEAVRRGRGAVDGGVTAGGHEHLHRLEEPGRTQVAISILKLLITTELVERLGLPALAQGRALALDDRNRDAVHEHDDVRDDVLFGAPHQAP
jgi:hypothetical protein